MSKIITLGVLAKDNTIIYTVDIDLDSLIKIGTAVINKYGYNFEFNIRDSNKQDIPVKPLQFTDLSGVKDLSDADTARQLVAEKARQVKDDADNKKAEIQKKSQEIEEANKNKPQKEENGNNEIKEILDSHKDIDKSENVTPTQKFQNDLVAQTRQDNNINDVGFRYVDGKIVSN